MRPDRNVFYALGRRYVQVRLADDEWEYGDGQPLHEGDGSEFGVGKSLMKDSVSRYSYDRDIWDSAMEEVLRVRNWDSTDDPMGADLGCGVLACEVGDY